MSNNLLRDVLPSFIRSIKLLLIRDWENEEGEEEDAIAAAEDEDGEDEEER